MICSSAGTMASAPSRPKRLVPVYFTSQNFSNASVSISLLRIARWPSGVKRMSFSSPSMRSWIHAFCAGLVMCMNCDADVPAVGAAQDPQDLAHGRRLEAEHAVDEDRPVEVGIREAVGLGLELAVHLAVGEAERIEIGGEMAHHAVGADQHQRADAESCVARSEAAGDISKPSMCCALACRLPRRLRSSAP